MGNGAISIPGRAGEVRIERDDSGVPHITASELNDAHSGLGFCHARDRALQMLLVRIVGRGQVCEHLRDTDESFAVDRFFRSLGLERDLETEEAALPDRTRAALEAYCHGVNCYFARSSIPWELRLLGYRIKNDPWTIADIFLTAKVVGYVALAQSQAEMERFIIECVQNGVPRDKLEELLPGQLGGLDESLIRQVNVNERVVPEALKWASALPRAKASNNWVIAGSKTESGKPILCNDPHLEVNRLPPIWYEAVMRWCKGGPERYAMGATMPGIPGVIVGRTPDVAWGVTYAFMDCFDSWIEDCRDGKYRRGEGWIPFRVRKEIICRQRRRPVEICFYSNEHGVLEGDPHVPGYYLTTRWSCGRQTSAQTLEVGLDMLEATTVEQGRGLLGNLNNSAWCWVLADRAGNIGFQMSGRMPLRRAGVSGLVPLPGWDPANDWQGFARPEDLPRGLNPPEGFIVTANHDLNDCGKVHPQNLPSAPYRAERIRQILSQEMRFSMEHMKSLQFDLYSTQAERFMTIIKPLLPAFEKTHGDATRILASWDLSYKSDSQGAFLFERVYRTLIDEVFMNEQQAGFGQEVMTRLWEETSVLADFYWNFDRVLLAEKSAWFNGLTREEIYTRVLAKALATQPQPYGQRRRVMLKHLLFGGKLPRWLGFDRGPVTLPGSRGTVHQGQIYRFGGRNTTFGPSLRTITDLAEDELHTTLPGGPSDRCWSKWYANGIEDWLLGRYKKLSGPNGLEARPD